MIIIILMIMPSFSSALFENDVIIQPGSGAGGGDVIYNITNIVSEMNQTPNQTPGYTPVFGVDYFNGSVGEKGETGETGAPGTTDYLQLINLPDLDIYWTGTNYNSTYDAALADTAPGSNTEIMFNYLNTESANASFTYNNTTGYVTAPYFIGDGSGLTNIGATAATSLTFSVKEANVGALKKGQSVYITGGSGGLPTVSVSDNTNTAKSRVVGLVADDINRNAAGKVRRGGTLTIVDTRTSNTAVNPNGETWSAGDLLFATTNGGLTNIRPTSGRSVKVAYSLSGSSVTDTLLVYPLENPVWSTAASAEDIVLRMGDSVGANKISFRNYTNYEVAWIRSNGTSSLTGSNYNASYWTGTNYNSSYWTGTNYNASYLTSTFNATYDAKTNYNASYWTGTNYNSSYWTGTNYNATYDAKTNYNASYLEKSGVVAMTGNLSMGSKYINNLVSGLLGSDAVNKSYVDAVNTSMKAYVDASGGSNYNATYDAKPTFSQVYPVGSIYISVSATNPGSLFGGTWAAFGTGRIPIGIDATNTQFDTVKETGGSNVSTSVVTHTHNTTVMVGTTDGTYGTFDSSSTSPGTSKVITSSAPAGAVASMSLMNPYIVVYMWERTA